MALSDFFDQGWSVDPAAIAYRHGDVDWTFEEAGSLSCRVANALLRDGMKPETKIGVLSPNDPAAWLCVIAAWRAGGTWVPLNPNSPITDSIGFINQFDCEILFYHPVLAAAVDEIHGAVGDRIQYICLEGDSVEALVGTPLRWRTGLASYRLRVRRSMFHRIPLR